MKIFRLLEIFRKKRTIISADRKRDNLMKVRIVQPLPEWCKWLTIDTLACIHDYCWKYNINPEKFNEYTRKELTAFCGRTAAGEIIDARGYETQAEKEQKDE